MTPERRHSTGAAGTGKEGPGGRPRLSRALLVAGGGVAVLLAFLAGAYLFQEQPPEEGMTAVRQLNAVYDMAVDPTDPDIVWLAGADGLVRLAEGRLFRVGAADRFLTGIVVLEDDEGAPLFLASGEGFGTMPDGGMLGLIASRDRGRSWEPVAYLGEAVFGVLRGGHYAGETVLYALGWDMLDQDTGLLRSDDGGETWLEVETGLALPLITLAIDPEDPDRLLSGTEEGFFSSGDGGDSWTPGRGNVADVPVFAVAFQPGQADRQYAYAFGFLRGLMRSDDGGGTWRQLGLDLGQQEAVITIAAVAPDTVYALVWPHSLWRSDDGGDTWRQLLRDGQPVRD